MPLSPGEPAPWFRAATPSNPEFTFDSVAGRYILLAFLPTDLETRGAMLRALSGNRALFDDTRLSAFAVVTEAQTAADARDMRGLRWVLDLDGAVSRQFDAADEDGVERPFWMILDPALRVLAHMPASQGEAMFRLAANLPQPGDHAGVPLHAPVLIAPRIFEPEFCRRLIELHEASQSEFTGVMRDAGRRTVHVMDELKKRRDVLVHDADLQEAVRERLEKRLFGHVQRALGFRITRIERFLVSCYDAEDGGVFHAHRDNTTHGTAHRRFAGSINLNGDFEGGDLRFAEFGPATYRPPVGGAAVFSCSLLHEATKVTKGRRYAFLPFFYDEAAAEVLETYRRGAAPV
jgi:predicted 2-oxoglutarate/Fe(II)-dependent dioxygenase YbiX/peroxiredoxin